MTSPDKFLEIIAWGNKQNPEEIENQPLIKAITQAEFSETFWLYLGQLLLYSCFSGMFLWFCCFFSHRDHQSHDTDLEEHVEAHFLKVMMYMC